MAAPENDDPDTVAAVEAVETGEFVPERPTNVVQALHAVMARVGGIEKTKAENLNYKIRGIDQIAAAAQPLFGQYGVLIVPDVLDKHVTPLVVNGKPWTDTEVTVRWRLYGPGGVDDIITSDTVGLGRDNSDKGINKAMTAAFKNLLLRILCIGDPVDDTDGHTHVEDAGIPTNRSPESLVVYDRLVSVDPDSTMAARLRDLSTKEQRRLTAREFDEHPEWRTKVAALLDTADQPVTVTEHGEIIPDTADPEVPDAPLDPDPDEPADAPADEPEDGPADEPEPEPHDR